MEKEEDWQSKWREGSDVTEMCENSRAGPVRTKTRRGKFAQFESELRIARAHRLRLAVTTNNVALVERLLSSGSDANASDQQHRSLLHLAACQGYQTIVHLLLSHGANPNQRDSLGNTPLHLAACTNHLAVVIDLLNAGTDISSLNRHGRNPVQLAQSKLKLMQLRSQSNSVDAENLKSDIKLVVNLMLRYLKTQRSNATEMEALSLRLENVSTKEQMDNEVSLLLKNIDSLTLSK
ncbi:ankyrin repeat domain-containing protein 54-like [Arctopsyche grandis]|uniref:ankyrin repeat domain-containing protein 54-like n=1 Tax=Arctopsyche grandis TaxID=121162 RepID=UPI00406DA25D